MTTVIFSPIPIVPIVGVFVGFTIIFMLKDAVSKIMTFVKGFSCD